MPLAIVDLRSYPLRSVFLWSVATAQPVAIDEDIPAQNSLVIDPWLAGRLREERGMLVHLLVGQPVKVAHVTAPF